MVRVHPDPPVAAEVFSCIILLVKFGIVFKQDDKKAQAVVSEIGDFLQKKGHKVLGETNLKGADVIITLGGDGTLIHKACELASQGVPLVGVNTGNLGFLTAAESREWKHVVDKLIAGNYLVSERISLDAKVGTGNEFLVAGKRKPETRNQKPETIYRAINEVVIKGLYRVVDLEINVGGEKFLKVLGDGVIVATQTGSTAYSLSAGGPIVDPHLDSILITPINPIGLPIPSAVISPEDEIEVSLIRGDDISLVLDGQEHTKLKEGDKVSIIRGEYKIKFVYFDKHQFIKSLNAKFGLSSRAGR